MAVGATPHTHTPRHAPAGPQPSVSVKRQDVDKAIAHLPPDKQNWAKSILNSTNSPGGKSVNVTPDQVNHFLSGLNPQERTQFLKVASDSRSSVPMDPSRIKVVEERSHAAPATPAQSRPTKAENMPINLHADPPESKGPGLQRRNAMRRPSTDGAAPKTPAQAKPSAQEPSKSNQLQLYSKPTQPAEPKPSASTPPQAAIASKPASTAHDIPSTFSQFKPQAQDMPSTFSQFSPKPQAMPSTFSPFNPQSQALTPKPQNTVSTQGGPTPPSTPATQAPASKPPPQGPGSTVATQTPPSTPTAQTPASTQANQATASAQHHQAPASAHHDSAPPSAGEQFLSKLGFSSKVVAGIAAFALAVPILSVLFAKVSPSDTSAGTPGHGM